LAALPRAILLDLDDTILASGQRPLVLLEVAETFAADLSPFTPAQLADDLEAALEAFWSDPDRHKEARFGIAAARRKVIGEVFAAAAAGALTPALADRFAARFTEYRDLAMEFFPTARETIEALKARGTRLGLITNGAGAVQRAKIERFALAPLFDHIQIEGEVGFGKPEERAYLHAMAALGVRAEETWMVGDNLEWEVAAPQRLGIHAIWYDGLGRGLPPESAIRPDRIIQRLAQLLDGADEGLSAGGNEGRDQA
jgi:putative hydrolase of the HAD superfamily